MESINLLIITPLIPPAPGGGGIYTQLLINGFTQFPEFGHIVVLTEAYPEHLHEEWSHNNRVCIKRSFPFRAGVSSKHWNHYLKYAYQNLQFLSICFVVRKYQITHVLIHSSFYNHINLMNYAVKILKKTSKVKLISDVRDPKLPPEKISQLDYYDNIICCSENIKSHLLSHCPILEKKLVLIPVIVDVKSPNQKEIESIQKKYGIYNRRYIINNSGIRREKGIDLLIEVVRILKNLNEDIFLVVTGKKRDWSDNHQKAVDDNLLIYLGPMSHSDVIALSSGASLDINLSMVDSMPRASLESVTLGTKVLLPNGVPEFMHSCPENVAVSKFPYDLAIQAKNILSDESYSLNYDISSHFPENILSHYINLFRL